MVTDVFCRLLWFFPLASVLSAFGRPSFENYFYQLNLFTMRKIYLFFLLLVTSLACHATIIVESGTKLYLGNAINSTDVPSGYYLIKSKSATYSETPYLVANGTALNLAASADLGGTNVGLWKIAYKQSATAENAKAAEYYILNVSTNKYFTQGPSVPLGDSKYKMWFEKTAEGTYQLGLSSSNSGLNQNAIGATSSTSFQRGSGEQDFELIPVNFFETPATVAEATKWYRIKGKKSGYVNYNASGHISLSNTVTGDDLWCFVPQADGTYQIYSKTDQTKVWGAFNVTTANTSGYIQLTTPDNASASATSFQILPTYANFPYMGFRINTTVSSTAYINQTSGTSLGSWNNGQAIYGWGANVNSNITGNGDDGSGYEFIEVDISESVNYTIASDVVGATVVYNSTTYNVGDNFSNSETILSASDFTAGAVDGYYTGVVTVTFESSTEATVHVAYAPINPIIPTTIVDGAFAENTQWYRLVINRNPKKYSKFNKVNNVTNNSTTKTTDRTSFFCFVADDAVNNGYKIYNMAAGTKKAFTSTGANDEICTYSEAGTTFVLEHNTTGADGYQFRVDGFTEAYFNDVNSQIGVWNHSSAATDAGGTFLLCEGKVSEAELASLSADFTELNALLAKAEQYVIGTGIGQYVDNSGGTFTTALAAARAIDQNRTDIAYQSTIDDAAVALNEAMASLSINIPATGKYYRMRVVSQSDAGDNYLSAYGNGINLNTKVTESEAPTVFYLTDENKLQVVYNDRYIKTASNGYEALQTTTNVDEAEIWTISGSTVTPGTYNLKAGETNLLLYDWTTYSRNNTLVSNEPSAPRCQWTIEEVVLDEDLIKTFDLSLISTTLQSVEPIALTEGAEVIYPTEYTYTPAELNASIAAVNAVSASNTLAEVKTVLNSTDYANVSHYKGLCESYGVALSVPCTLKYRFSTLILPINYAFPSTWSVYSCSAADENDVLTLSTVTSGGSPKNTPFIVEYTDEATMPTAEAPKTYQFIGYSNGAATENQTSGWLTGVLTAGGATVPTNSYALAVNKTTGKQGFYKTDGTVTCPQYKCYLTVPAETAAPKALFFPGGEGQQTGIENVFGGDENGTVTIYNLAGQRLNKLEKGINIVNGRKVLVK